MSARLLLVDDDPFILDTAKDILEDAGYEVDSAETVAKALACVAAAMPSVILVDLHLKDGSGLDLARQVHASHPSIPIVLMTGEAHVDLAPAQGGIRQTLLKPVHPQLLLDTLKTLI